MAEKESDKDNACKKNAAPMKVLISTSSFAGQDSKPLDLLKKAGYDIVMNPHGRRLQPSEVVQPADGAEGMIAGTEPLTDAVFSQMPALRVISRCGSGLDTVDLKAAAHRHIQVLSTPEAPVEAVAELTLTLMLSVLRRVAEADQRLRAAQWKPLMGHLLDKKTVGIVGLGRIGRRVVQLLKPFHVKVLAFDHQPNHSFAERHHVLWRDLHSLLKESDIVSLHISLDPGTRGLIGPKELDGMKKSAYLINASRGELVDDQALADALLNGRLRGAGVDVYPKEPYQGPLLKCSNAVLTSHMGSYAEETRAAMEYQSAVNLIKGLRARRRP